MKAQRIDGNGTSRPQVSRRKALQTLATGVGATIAAPIGMAGAGHVHPAVAVPLEQAAANAAGRLFLSPHQLATLETLAALILPGAEASGTPAFLDKMLAVDSVEARRRFVSALGAFDGAAMRSHGRAFKDVTPAEQTAILTQASTMAVGMPRPGSEPANLRDHFDHLKALIADVHFSSEVGLRELGSTGNMVHTRFNGCATQP